MDRLWPRPFFFRGFKQLKKDQILPEIQVWIDGAFVEPEHACVSVFDRGFLYGDSVFETLRTYGGRPFSLEQHLERLEESARRVWIELPLDRKGLAREVVRAVRRSGYAECYVRLMVTRGVGALGLDPQHAVHPCRVLLVGPLVRPPESFYSEGVSVITFETARAGDATQAAGAKIGNYLVAVLANREAARVGAKEALICDSSGRVVEGATSNVFWFSDGAVHTPPLEAGILPGITRAHVLEVSRQLGLRVVYRVPHKSDLQQAQEVFISSSIRELVPVVAIDGEPVGTGYPGPTTKRLLAAFRAHCQRHCAEAGPSADSAE